MAVTVEVAVEVDAGTMKLVPSQKEKWASVCSGSSGGPLRYSPKEAANSSIDDTLYGIVFASASRGWRPRASWTGCVGHWAWSSTSPAGWAEAMAPWRRAREPGLGYLRDWVGSPVEGVWLQ